MEEERRYPPLDEKTDDLGIADNIDLITKFSMEQNLGHYGYEDRLRHLNKNILFTNLSRQYNEPETIQSLSKAVTILAQHEETHTIPVQIGEKEVLDKENNRIIIIPVYQEQTIELPRFKRTHTYISGKIFTITSTAAGTNAKLLELLRSTFLHKDHTIEDKTKTEGGLWSKLKGKR